MTRRRGRGVDVPLGERDPFGAAPNEAVARREHVAFFRPQAYPGVELWDVQRSARRWTVHHEAYTFCNVEAFTQPDEAPGHRWWYRRRTYSLNLDSVMLLEPGELHVTTSPIACDFFVLAVEPALVARLFGPLPGVRAPHFRLGQKDDASLAHRFRTLCWALLDSETTFDPLLFEEALIAFLAGTVRAAGEAPLPAPRYCRRSIKLARSYLHDHFRERVSLGTLAALGGHSPWHFARSFHAEIGLPPGRYLRCVRIGKALEYLRSGMHAHQVATLVGFYDQAQLTRAFRRELGFTPAYFRRAGGALDQQHGV